MVDSRQALCVALDGSDRGWLEATARSLAGTVGWVKVGLESFTAHGPSLVGALVAAAGRVFLDLKLHDIPETVRRSSANCAAAGADLLTVHAAGGRAMLEAARVGARSAGPARVVAVTVLTSLDGAALAELGLPSPTEPLVVRWARLARDAGLDGVVCSAREAAAVRAACGAGFLVVTPGVRPAGSAADDQRRVVTPTAAILAGADLLVVGRPITAAPDPVEAARGILAEVARARQGVGAAGAERPDRSGEPSAEG